MTNLRRTLTVALLTFVVSGALKPGIAFGLEVDPQRSAAVRAGIVLNFLRFTEWPERAFADETSPIVVTIVGDDALAVNLAQLVRDERVGAGHRAIAVHSAEVPASGGDAQGRFGPQEGLATRVKQSHVLFIGESERRRAAWLLDQVETDPVLTVGDSPEFASNGGMLGLVVRDGRMTFDANPGRIAPAGINVSSKLLRLARTVETRAR